MALPDGWSELNGGDPYSYPKPPDWEAQETVEPLNELIKRYLDLVNEYQVVQLHSGERFAAGFIALAHANFTLPNRSYGQDSYDSRMQALRRMYLESSSTPKVPPALHPWGKRLLLMANNILLSFEPVKSAHQSLHQTPPPKPRRSPPSRPPC